MAFTNSDYGCDKEETDGTATHHPAVAVGWWTADMAVQPRMGLLPERRLGVGPRGAVGLAAAWKIVKARQKT